MKKIMLVFGTRPEAIKMAPLVKEFQKHPDKFQTIVCVTAQHREMLDQVLHLFDIKPDYDLNLMKKGQDLYDITSRVLLGMRDVLKEAQPDMVLVHGDTTTSSASALAAFYQQIPVGHVEAGLRTHNIYSPWPEEMNRQLTGRISTFHFAPTELSKQNLLKEGVSEDRIFVTGNTVIDALYMVLDRINGDEVMEGDVIRNLEKNGLPRQLIETWSDHNGATPSPHNSAAHNDLSHNSEASSQHNGATHNDLSHNGVAPSLHNPTPRRLVLITGHRRENFGEGFLNICRAIKTLAEKYPDVDFVYPMHLNPNVRKPIEQVFGSITSHHSAASSPHNFHHSEAHNDDFHHGVAHNIHFIEPLEYLPFVYLMSRAYLVLTDSGGIQEEAPGLGKPVLVMRDTTERPEAVDAGTVKLVGTDEAVIIRDVSALIESPQAYHQMAQANNPYGDGKGCERIVNFI